MSANRFTLFPDAIIIHRGCSRLICDRSGCIGGGANGFYVGATRFLSRLDLAIDGHAPRLVSANAVAAHSMIAYFLAPSPAGAAAGPEPRQGNGGEIAQKAIELQVDRVVDGGLHQAMRITNRGMAEARFELTLRVDADFADQSEVKSGKRRQRAAVEQTWQLRADRAELSLDYAHPDLRLGVLVRVAGGGRRHVRDGVLAVALSLPPRGSERITVAVSPRLGDELIEPGITAFVGDQHEDALPAATRLTTPAVIVQQAWNRAAGDLAALALRTGDGAELHLPAAGIPMYQGLFGRDVLIAGAQARLLSPLMLRGALSVMAKWQGRRYDPERDEEPGKILHQRQLGPLSLLGMTPFAAYYGDYTAPAMFLIGAALDFAATGDRAFVRSMRPHILAVLDWMARDGDRDGDGFYEYETRAAHGLKNQGWKDSGQAVLYPDGRVVENPIAMAEIQGAYFAAKQLTGLLFLMNDETTRGEALLDEAAALKRRFNARFWDSERRYVAMALDAAKEPVMTEGPDGGQCLAYGIVDADKSAALVERLMRPDLFTGWGLRTLSTAHPAYNPFGYHLGDVWPWANALIGFGLRRFGFEAEFARIARSMFEATQLFALERLPEAIGGHARDTEHPHPGIYPDSNWPQAWSASAIISLVETMLGVVPLAPLDTLLLDPALPPWLPEATLANFQIGTGAVTLRFARTASGRTEVEVVNAPAHLTIRSMDAAPRGADKLEHAIRALPRAG